MNSSQILVLILNHIQSTVDRIGADLQKSTGTMSIYSGLDVVQNQYQDLF